MKKASLLVLGVTSVIFSRVVFLFFNDPEGPNLLVVIGTAVIIYMLSLTAYMLASSRHTRLLLALCIQILLCTSFYMFLK